MKRDRGDDMIASSARDRRFRPTALFALGSTSATIGAGQQPEEYPVASNRLASGAASA
jgi:hypothetical protein